MFLIYFNKILSQHFMGGGVLMRKLLSAKAAVTDSVRVNVAVMGKEAEQHNPNEKGRCISSGGQTV